MTEPKVNPIRCLAIGSPARDSAYLSVTRMDGSTERFHLEYTQLQLLNVESAIKLGNWPVEPSVAA